MSAAPRPAGPRGCVPGPGVELWMFSGPCFLPGAWELIGGRWRLANALGHLPAGGRAKVVSCGRAHDAAAERLAGRLRARGYRVWVLRANRPPLGRPP